MAAETYLFGKIKFRKINYYFAISAMIQWKFGSELETYTVCLKKRHSHCTLYLQRTSTDIGYFWQRCCWVCTLL